MWIGASDLKDGQFLWNEDFSTMKYANWKKGEPNGGSNENCVILLGNAYYGRWNDMSCDYSVQFLCKKKMVRF